jgi:hypothetical protein
LHGAHREGECALAPPPLQHLLRWDGLGPVWALVPAVLRVVGCRHCGELLGGLRVNTLEAWKFEVGVERAAARTAGGSAWALKGNDWYGLRVRG